MLTATQLRTLRAAPNDGPNKIRLAMFAAGVTQVELEHAIGLPQPYISAIIRGKSRRLPLSTARKFADYFKCSVDDLFPAQELSA